MRWLKLASLFLLLSLFVAPVFADLLYTQGSGTTLFDFLCFTTKHCSAHVNINSAGTEIGTTSAPINVQITAGGNTAKVQAGNAAAAGDLGVTTVNPALNVNTQTTAHGCNTAGFSALGCLGQIDDDVKTPPTLGSASGGSSVKTLAALSNTAIAVKASAGQVFRGQCSNRDATNWASIQIFNVAAASVTMGTTAPTDFVDIPPGTNTGFVFSLVGEQYSTAISAGAATTPTGGTAPVTALNCTISYN